MKYSVFAIRDFKTGFLQPTVDANAASAIRNFEHAVLRNDDSLFFSHPEDYSLYELGEYDTDTGLLTAKSPVVELLSAVEVISQARLEAARKAGFTDGK